MELTWAEIPQRKKSIHRPKPRDLLIAMHVLRGTH